MLDVYSLQLWTSVSAVFLLKTKLKLTVRVTSSYRQGWDTVGYT